MRSCEDYRKWWEQEVTDLKGRRKCGRDDVAEEAGLNPEMETEDRPVGGGGGGGGEVEMETEVVYNG